MTKSKSKRITLPVSDTVPGPGTLEVGIVMDQQHVSKIPSVEIEDTPDYIGHGTADDVSSTPSAPEPKNVKD